MTAHGTDEAQHELAHYIDHTLLKATAGSDDIRKLCREAREHRFFSVCVNSCWVPLAKEELQGSGVRVCTVVGFPLGAMSREAKVFEASTALSQGASEIDMVLNVGFLREGRYEEVQEEIRQIKEAIGDALLKVIIETCYLTDQEKVQACRLAVAAGADYVKTSTGFGTGGAVAEDLQLMLEAVEGKALVKASGGVRDAATARAYIALGVRRLGTSNGIEIVSGNAPDSGPRSGSY
ncbi:2-deoxyribose-5-phosphate aldolase [Alkalispirochaeta sphaeroplastigenens]|uniref:Deoxyribose-phosphate aldolase n=1 Tax=Alkalispirochaeta sphaeroplastigenens TaxID=1187066 RepID=A0A2S4JUB9_9SPIO|nr:deoxyribose-phosphate aldolase [Alkalispirochaeta sphaeroplastigenens]POR03090.1 2-deoxyribose-5-phosphate aldolase [Alkalispirochaeta sphaeroplastigenens]